MNRMIKRLALPLGAATILGTAGFAYMAGNTVPATNVGEGAGAISGYTVSNVHYDYETIAGDPSGATYIHWVSFELTPANPSGVATAHFTDKHGNQVGLDYQCNVSNAGVWTCVNQGGAGDAATTVSAEHLVVTAAQ